MKGATVVFESYSPKAIRAIFNARLAVSMVGGPEIEPPHLLFGILRANPGGLASTMDSNALDELRESLETAMRRPGSKPSTSEDVRMSAAAQEVLRIAEDERAKLDHPRVEVGHLVLGVLLAENPTKELLIERGVTAGTVRGRLPSDEADERPQAFSIG